MRRHQYVVYLKNHQRYTFFISILLVLLAWFVANEIIFFIIMQIKRNYNIVSVLNFARYGMAFGAFLLVHPLKMLLARKLKVKLLEERYGPTGSHLSEEEIIFIEFLCKLNKYRLLHGYSPSDSRVHAEAKRLIKENSLRETYDPFPTVLFKFNNT